MFPAVLVATQMLLATPHNGRTSPVVCICEVLNTQHANMSVMHLDVPHRELTRTYRRVIGSLSLNTRSGRLRAARSS
ncbi:hypothetical protein B0H11DRAFT_2071053 [Mycena galericulata]|nr:hypothetical protein B0H11DRAFT_2071053 [Mycena galericulata]